MPVVAKGNKVQIEYVGRLKNGTTFDRSDEGKPLEFIVGEGKVIPGFEQAVEGMNMGEAKTVEIASDKAYGAKDASLVRRFPLSMLPEGEKPEKGMVLSLGLPSGDTLPATITEITDSDVFVDLNHPLAGEDLIFDLKVVGIE